MFSGDSLPWQFVRYGIVGGVAVSTHLAVLSALIEWGHIEKITASVIGFACAIPVNYLLQHRFVFERRGRHWAFFTRYVGVTTGMLGLNAALFWVVAEVVGLHYLIAQMIAIAVVFVANFLTNRIFTFARPIDVDKVPVK